MEETVIVPVKKPWMLWYHEGQLFGKGAKKVARIKAFLVPLRSHMSSLPGCNFEGRQFMLLQGVQDSDGSLTLLIHDTRNQSTASFRLKPEEKCGITYDGKKFRKQELPPFMSFYLPAKYKPVVEKKLPSQSLFVPAGLTFDMHRDGMFSSFGYWQKKMAPSNPGVGRAVALYNDGIHLYVKHGDGAYRHLPFRLYRREFSCYMIPGFHFPELSVVFKTHGHTLNGSVTVSIRHLDHNWSLIVSIAPKATAIVYDVGTDLRVAFMK